MTECVKWDGSVLSTKTLQWNEFININKDWWFTRHHYTDGTYEDDGPHEAFKFATPIDTTMDCYNNPDGWINKEILHTFYDDSGAVIKELVRLHYPDGTALDGIEFHNVLDTNELPPGAIEMPKQDI